MPDFMVRFKLLSDPTSGEITRIIQLYRLAGWWGDSGDDPDLIRRLVAGSHMFAVALGIIDKKEKIIGMGRVISDGVSDAYIQDVTVDPAFRNKQVATELIRLLIRRLAKDHIPWIGLIAERGTHPLYEKLGFSPMPDSVPMRFFS